MGRGIHRARIPLECTDFFSTGEVPNTVKDEPEINGTITRSPSPPNNSTHVPQSTYFDYNSICACLPVNLLWLEVYFDLRV